MYLNEAARKFYDLEVITDPVLPGLEASFDNGLTWHEGEAVLGGFRWLVAGPRFNHATRETNQVDILLPTVVPKVRISAAPQFEIQDAPPITLTK